MFLQNSKLSMKLVLLERSFPHSWFIAGFITRLTRCLQMVEQDLLTLPEHLSSPPDFSGFRVTLSLALCVCPVDRCLSFVLFRLIIVLSVLLRFTESDYPFDIFKLFFGKVNISKVTEDVPTNVPLVIYCLC
jgi:hypothetical protein